MMDHNSQNRAEFGCQQCRVSPFSIRVLEHTNLYGIKSLRSNFDLPSQLPALYREGSGDLTTSAHNITACIEKELDLDRLASVHSWLWIAGLPLPPRALHHQILLGREICITEQMDLHLVWRAGQIFIKPIPRFLLEPDFWIRYLGCEHKCEDSRDSNKVFYPASYEDCKIRVLRRRALGFLFSYAALLSHESDFLIAQDKHLLPQEVKWPAWRILVQQLDTEHIYPYIDHRFVHGELRLSRLDKIYAIYQTPLRRYTARWDRYSAFFHDQFALLASVTIYIAIVLSALQVGLASDVLGKNSAFQSTSRGFTIFSILGPPIGASLIMLQFCYIFILNWVKAHNRKKRRYSELLIS